MRYVVERVAIAYGIKLVFETAGLIQRRSPQPE